MSEQALQPHHLARCDGPDHYRREPVVLTPAARDVLLLAASGCDLGADARTPTTVEVVGWLTAGETFRRPVPPAVLAELVAAGLLYRMPQHQLEWFEVTRAGRAWVAAHVTLGA